MGMERAKPAPFLVFIYVRKSTRTGPLEARFFDPNFDPL